MRGAGVVRQMVFFFSSRRRHTRFKCDWSSDVCSSDLAWPPSFPSEPTSRATMVDQLNSFASEVTRVAREVGSEGKLGGQAVVPGVGGTWKDLTDNVNSMARSEERRVGKECRSRWSPYH